MPVGEAEAKDRKAARTIGVVLLVLFVALAAGALMLYPMMASFVEVHFAPGLGLKQAAVIAFFITLAVFVVFAIAAGDGLIGELQYMLGGFMSFFVVVWLMVAWIF
ncbi:hypothetical protein [Polycyclovorans algicola]|uniref:hypothetical protein n=1 Tax=Polycyclovorans algicola TaxID=616992 RepID=UPI0004A76294|nr:hypothetical protein [Polycyclovorans algicola]